MANKIEPSIILTIDNFNIFNIPLIVTNNLRSNSTYDACR